MTHLAIYFIGGWIFFEVAVRIKSLAPIIKKYKPLIDGVIHNLVSSSLLYVILGVIIYTILSALCGALVSRAEDASKATQPTMVLTIWLASLEPFRYSNHQTIFLSESFLMFHLLLLSLCRFG